MAWKQNRRPLAGGGPITDTSEDDSRAAQGAGLPQGKVAPQIEIEGRPISQTYLSDIERGHIRNPRPYLIEEFARVLEIDRDVLYLAAGRCRRKWRRS